MYDSPARVRKPEKKQTYDSLSHDLNREIGQNEDIKEKLADVQVSPKIDYDKVKRNPKQKNPLQSFRLNVILINCNNS